MLYGASFLHDTYEYTQRGDKTKLATSSLSTLFFMMFNSKISSFIHLKSCNRFDYWDADHCNWFENIPRSQWLPCYTHINNSPHAIKVSAKFIIQPLLAMHHGKFLWIMVQCIKRNKMNRDNATMSTNESHDPNQRFHLYERECCMHLQFHEPFCKNNKTFFLLLNIFEL